MRRIDRIFELGDDGLPKEFCQLHYTRILLFALSTEFNKLPLAAVILAVLSFGSSDKLGAAYGIAVTATMLTTTILTFFVVRYGWKHNLLLCWLATGFFLIIDITLFSANTLKILQGGWFPLLLGAAILTLMLTWEQGRQMVFASIRGHAIPIADFLQSLFLTPPSRVQGMAIFFRPPGEGVPHVMLHNLSHNKILHERVVFLSVNHVDIPHIPDETLVKIEPLGNDCYQLSVHYGFKDERDIPQALALCKAHDLQFDLMETSFFISRQTVIPRPGKGMSLWREALFAAMYRNARDAADYYRLPANRVIELGTQVEI